MAGQIFALEAGDAVTVRIGDGIKLTLIPGTDATITYSKVDDRNADAHSDETTDVTEETEVDPAWPFYRVSVADGPARVGVA